MSLYILRWNPAISSYKKQVHLNVLEHVREEQYPVNFDWSIREWENLKKDDLFILQQVGTDHDGIAMIGKFKDKCHEGESWRKNGTKLHYADMWILDAFDCDTEDVLPAWRYEKLFPGIKWHGGYSGVLVEDGLAKKLLETIEQDVIKSTLWDEQTFSNFLKCDFNALEEDFSKTEQGRTMRPTKESLEDGTYLVSTKENFLKNLNKNTFVQFVCCMHDSEVLVPVTIRKIKEKGVDANQLLPVIIDDEGNKKSMLVFSNDEQLKDNFQDDNFEIYKVPLVDCCKLMKETKGFDQIVLDPVTNPMTIDMELGELISSIGYKKKTEEKADGGTD